MLGRLDNIRSKAHESDFTLAIDECFGLANNSLILLKIELELVVSEDDVFLVSLAGFDMG